MVVVWLFSTFTLAEAFNDHKEKEEKKDLYQLRRTLRQDVEECIEGKKRPGGLSAFMAKTCIDIEEEYKITVEEIEARWGKK